jgi:hypothetical protein
MAIVVRNLRSVFSAQLVTPGEDATVARADVRAGEQGVCFACGTDQMPDTFTLSGGLVPGTVLADHDGDLYPARLDDEPVAILGQFVGGPLDEVANGQALVFTSGTLELLFPAFVAEPVPARGARVVVGLDSRLRVAEAGNQVGVVAEDSVSPLRGRITLQLGNKFALRDSSCLNSSVPNQAPPRRANDRGHGPSEMRSE